MKKIMIFAASLLLLAGCEGTGVGGSKLLGDVPSIIQNVNEETNKLLQELTSINTEAEAVALQQKAEKLLAETQEKFDAATEGFEGKEIPVEIADSVPVELTTPLTVKEVQFKQDKAVVTLVAEGKLTAECAYKLNDPDHLYANLISAFCANAEGEGFYTDGQVKFEGYKDLYPVGEPFTFTATLKVCDYNAELFKDFAKVVISLKDSEAYKAANQNNSDIKNAFKADKKEK